MNQPYTYRDAQFRLQMNALSYSECYDEGTPEEKFNTLLANQIDVLPELVSAARNCLDVIREDYVDRGDCGLWSKPGSALRRLEKLLDEVEGGAK